MRRYFVLFSIFTIAYFVLYVMETMIKYEKHLFLKGVCVCLGEGKGRGVTKKTSIEGGGFPWRGGLQTKGGGLPQKG